jgi:hypothetical protein
MKQYIRIAIAIVMIAFTAVSCTASRSTSKGGGCYATKGMVGYR